MSDVTKTSTLTLTSTTVTTSTVVPHTLVHASDVPHIHCWKDGYFKGDDPWCERWHLLQVAKGIHPFFMYRSKK